MQLRAGFVICQWVKWNNFTEANEGKEEGGGGLFLFGLADCPSPALNAHESPEHQTEGRSLFMKCPAFGVRPEPVLSKLDRKGRANV